METTTTLTESEEQLSKLTGAFVTSLQRNNKQIRSDRALDIAEDARRQYKREVEDLHNRIGKVKRERNNMLDLSASDKNSLILAANFDASEFVSKDIELGLIIRQLEIKLEEAKKRFKVLFDEEITF